METFMFIVFRIAYLCSILPLIGAYESIGEDGKVAFYLFLTFAYVIIIRIIEMADEEPDNGTANDK